MKYIFIGLAIYFLYRFIFNFIIPIYRVSKQMKGQMREFQSRMNTNGQGFQNEGHQPPPHQNSATKPATTEGEYIDFEEIK
jgi:hypothetical protein